MGRDVGPDTSVHLPETDPEPGREGTPGRDFRTDDHGRGAGPTRPPGARPPGAGWRTVSRDDTACVEEDRRQVSCVLFIRLSASECASWASPTKMDRPGPGLLPGCVGPDGPSTGVGGSEGRGQESVGRRVEGRG